MLAINEKTVRYGDFAAAIDVYRDSLVSAPYSSDHIRAKIHDAQHDKGYKSRRVNASPYSKDGRRRSYATTGSLHSSSKIISSIKTLASDLRGLGNADGTSLLPIRNTINTKLQTSYAIINDKEYSNENNGESSSYLKSRTPSNKMGVHKYLDRPEVVKEIFNAVTSYVEASPTQEEIERKQYEESLNNQM